MTKARRNAVNVLSNIEQLIMEEMVEPTAQIQKELNAIRVETPVKQSFLQRLFRPTPPPMAPREQIELAYRIGISRAHTIINHTKVDVRWPKNKAISDVMTKRKENRA